MSETTQIEGLDDLLMFLRQLPKALRRRVLRNAANAGGRVFRDAARAIAPVLARPTRYRTPGLLKSQILVRSSRRDASAGDIGVFVNVKPAKGGNVGAKSARDPFYWRFVKYNGEQWAPAMAAAASRVQGQALSAVVDQIAPALQRLERSSGKALGKLEAL